MGDSAYILSSVTVVYFKHIKDLIRLSQTQKIKKVKR
jgi:hypothetical protein